mgnify:CR=1 FL=1
MIAVSDFFSSDLHGLSLRDLTCKQVTLRPAPPETHGDGVTVRNIISQTREDNYNSSGDESSLCSTEQPDTLTPEDVVSQLWCLCMDHH